MRSAILRVLAEHGPNATFRIGNLLSIGNPRVLASTRRVRTEMLRLERDGKVKRYPASTCNNTIWEIAAAPKLAGEE